jgi:hypothetical protein
MGGGCVYLSCAMVAVHGATVACKADMVEAALHLGGGVLEIRRMDRKSVGTFAAGTEVPGTVLAPPLLVEVASGLSRVLVHRGNGLYLTASLAVDRRIFGAEHRASLLTDPVGRPSGSGSLCAASVTETPASSTSRTT